MTDSNASKKSVSELARRGYSGEEVGHIYGLARRYLLLGNTQAAQALLVGLVRIAPDFLPGVLGLAAVHMLGGNFDSATKLLEDGLKVDPDSVEAMLFLVVCLFNLGDLNAAGTHLGEVGEKVQSQLVQNPELVRFYKVLVARYETR